MLLYWIADISIVFHCKHNNKIHSYIQNLNTSNTAQSLFKPFPRNQLATKAQSFPRKFSNTGSPIIARHAKGFTWNRGCSSNSPPLTHGDQIPHPLEDSDNQIPSSPERQRCQMPGVCPGEGMLKLRFDRYISFTPLFSHVVHKAAWRIRSTVFTNPLQCLFKVLFYFYFFFLVIKTCLFFLSQYATVICVVTQYSPSKHYFNVVWHNCLCDNQNNNRFSLQGTYERKRNTGNDVAKAAAQETGLLFHCGANLVLLTELKWDLATLERLKNGRFGPVILNDKLRLKTPPLKS